MRGPPVGGCGCYKIRGQKRQFAIKHTTSAFSEKYKMDSKKDTGTVLKAPVQLGFPNLNIAQTGTGNDSQAAIANTAGSGVVAPRAAVTANTEERTQEEIRAANTANTALFPGTSGEERHKRKKPTGAQQKKLKQQAQSTTDKPSGSQKRLHS